jgi:glycosyltransferase involved in cell wall biosynthesis
MTPEITVITATYNSSQTLAWTIASVLQQDFTNFEYIIVGDACTDNTAEVVASFNDPRIYFVNLPKNSGSQAAPNNQGLELAKGKWISYLGHDDLWFPWHLLSLLSIATANNSSLAYGMCALIEPNGLNYMSGIRGARRTIYNYIVAPSSWLHRHTEQRWRDPNQLAIGVDTDFLLRFTRANQTVSQSGRLSVLKYPSPWWRLYKKTKDFPQQLAWQEIQQNALHFEHKILIEAAQLASKLRSRHLTLLQSIKEGIKPLATNLLIHFPTFILFRWYFQYLRVIIRRQRGLPPKH